MANPKIILFVCAENSARSQMAEVFFNSYNNNPNYKSISAGVNPAKEIKTLAIKVMKEKNIDLSKQKPKSLKKSTLEKAYKIFTMGCIKECPLTLPEKTTDWNLEDPAEESIDSYRQVRDEIENKIKQLITELK